MNGWDIPPDELVPRGGDQTSMRAGDRSGSLAQHAARSEDQKYPLNSGQVLFRAGERPSRVALDRLAGEVLK
jgi:hypothetical protein